MTNNTQIDKVENTELLCQNMEQRMKGIYKDIRDLFFCFDHVRLPEFENFNPPKIELSDVIKTKILGKYPLEQVIKRIESMMDQIRTADRLKEAVGIIEKIIKNYNYDEISNKSDFERLLKELCYILDKALADGEGVFNNDGDNRIVEAIDLLKNTQKNVFISGEFSAEKNLITLYTKAIQQCSDSNSYSNRLLTTLAHEMFHAMHCYVTGKNQWDKEDTEAKLTVIESLARWAEYCWCRHQGKEFQSIADKKNLEWETSDFPSDPYSGAKVFDKKTVTDLDFDVLEASVKDWDEAYSMMESFRNGDLSKESEGNKINPLFFWRQDFSNLISDIDFTEWAIIYPFNKELSEKDNLELCKLVKDKFEQRGCKVTCIQCEDNFLKRSNDKGVGNSTLLFIKNGDLIREQFANAVQEIVLRYLTVYSYVTSNLNDHNSVFLNFVDDLREVSFLKIENRYGEEKQVLFEKYFGYVGASYPKRLI